ncbi:XRE family transcriptional regulator [Periweissella cryptocerci]|uniref:XRE family transcriptional regulator n=1 Tax=Periweissella cryptocerci TaxID=2506420 RepID=A0A4P6YWN7_9LACO|nr:helix-turn-helix transcriptional regulator [Periweissella cryptocerci]QBO37244.1 XRE family transcriptional regulator [Periweissella cryptocerci]
MKFDLNRLKGERVSRGWTQEELAFHLDWSREKYAAKERGRISMSADELALVASALGVSDVGRFFTIKVDK